MMTANSSPTHSHPHANVVQHGQGPGVTGPVRPLSGGIGGGDARETPGSPSIDPGWLVRAVLREVADDHIVLEILNTNYRVHLVPTAPISTPVGKRISGRIDAHARRIDICHTGGNYIDPVFGRPRNLQGRVLGHLESQGIVIVKPVVPMFIRVHPPQTPAMFADGEMVTFAIEPGATFTPVEL